MNHSFIFYLGWIKIYLNKFYKVLYLVRGKRSGWIVLHIVVSIKQVPDTKIIKMNPKTNTMDRASAPAILNPYDTHAVQEAVRLKEQYGGIVSVVSMGPPQAVKAIQKCLEIGADEGYLISDRAFAVLILWQLAMH